VEEFAIVAASSPGWVNNAQHREGTSNAPSIGGGEASAVRRKKYQLLKGTTKRLRRGKTWLNLLHARNNLSFLGSLQRGLGACFRTLFVRQAAFNDAPGKLLEYGRD